MLVFHFFEIIPKLSKCWSFIRVFLPAFRHNSISTIESVNYEAMNVKSVRRRGGLMMIISYSGVCWSPATALKVFVLLKCWTKGKKCRVVKLKLISISCKGTGKRQRENGLGDGSLTF